MILVTGGSGFVGSHVVELLLQHGCKVRVLEHCISGNLTTIPPKYKDLLEIVYGDIRNPDTCLSITKNVEGVIHLAAAIHVDDSISAPREHWNHNVYGTFNLLEGMRANDIKRLTYLSTAEVYGNVVSTMANETTPVDPQSPYAASKYAS
jgi:nucleoside-diphosphate-sugar epimerase